jgi:oxygen-dependent protoporphyrinogen oxidase
MADAPRPIRVAIIGGGISGLSAAWFLQKAAAKKGIQYAVFESGGRWGGKVLSERVDQGGQFIIEAGPDSFLTQKPWALGLARELGLESRLLGTNDHRRAVYVLHKGKPLPMPKGIQLIAPTQVMPFLRSPLISPLGKLRMGLEWFLPPRSDEGDESLADFVLRRLGAEALDKLAEPLMAGIYSGEAEHLSLLATFPRFRQLEREHGGVLRGTLAAKRKQPPSNADKPAVSAFVSLVNGTEELIHALVAHLDGELRLNTPIALLERTPEGRYRLICSNGEALDYDAVILTAPAPAAAELLRPLAPAAADQLSAIQHASTGTVSLAFREADWPRPLNGFGLVIPRSEGRPINAITVASTKFNCRAPEGYSLLRVFFGGRRSAASMSLDDAALLNVVRRELAAILGITAQPLFHRIYRWERANPQYEVGHLQRVDAIERELPAGIYLAGSAYRGVGLPDCIHQAEQTVEWLIREMNKTA